MATPKIHRRMGSTANVNPRKNVSLCNMNKRRSAATLTNTNEEVTCGSCRKSMRHSWNWPTPPTLKRKEAVMAKPKLPKKMTVAQKRKVWTEFTPDAVVEVTFAPIDTFTISHAGEIFMEVSMAMLPIEMLSAIAGRQVEQFEVDPDYDGDDESGGSAATLYYDGDDYDFTPADPCIHSVEIVQHGKKTQRVPLYSIDETLELTEDSDHVTIGCRRLEKEDAEKAATAIFKWLGYEVS